MKRPLADGDADSTVAGNTDSATAGTKDANKKIKQEEKGDMEEEMLKAAEAVLMDENLLYEVLRRVDDGRTLAKAACVSQQWKQTAHDERIWELICTRHYHSSPMQLRAVVSRLGGFRRLFSSHLWPLLKPSSSTPPTVSSWPCIPPTPAPGAPRSKARWGKDEVNLSLSLLSIKYFEKMSFNKRSK